MDQTGIITSGSLLKSSHPLFTGRVGQAQARIKMARIPSSRLSFRSLYTQSSRHTRRTVTIRPQEQYQALKQRRAQEMTKNLVK